MDAKEYQEIVNTADCNAEVNYVSGAGELRILGWAKRLIEAAYHSRDSEVAEARKAGREDVAEYIDTHCYNSVSGWHLCTLDIEAFRRGEIPEKQGIKEE